MKGLTLWQPWASLVGRGKHLETRSWAIVAVANLADYNSVENINMDLNDRLLGDYSYDRWAWKLSDIVLLDEPLPFKGCQGLWNVPEDIENQVEIIWRSIRAAENYFFTNLFSRENGSFM